MCEGFKMYTLFTKIIVLRYGGKYSLGSSGVIGLNAPYLGKLWITSWTPLQISFGYFMNFGFYCSFFIFFSCQILSSLICHFYHILQDLGTFRYEHSEQDMGKILAIKIMLMDETECDDNQPDQSDNTWVTNERERSETFVPPWDLDKNLSKKPAKFGPKKVTLMGETGCDGWNLQPDNTVPWIWMAI